MGLKRAFRCQFLVLLLFPVGLAVYSAALRAPFAYDDRGFIVQNPAIRSLSNFLDISGTRYIGFLSFAVNYAISGLTPFDFHITNVIIHIINSVLVFSLVSSVTEAPLFRGAEAGGKATKAAFTAAAFAASFIFLSHPAGSQAVAYVTQRFASLATLFYLSAVLFYAKARALAEKETGKARRRAFYALSLIATVAAMKTKEVSFTIPFAIALYDYTFFPATFAKKGARMRVPFYLTLVIIPLSLIIPEITGEGRGMTEELRRMELHDAGTISRYEYMVTELGVVVTYMRLLLFPVGQQIDYDYPVSKSIFEPGPLLSFFILSTLFISSALILKRSRASKNPFGALYSFGIFWFFLTLSVESSVIPIQDVIFEHRIYLPSAGFIVSFSSAVFFFIDRLRQRGLVIRDGVAAVVIIALLCPPLIYALHKRNLLWTDELILLDNAIEKSPAKGRLYYARSLVHMDRKEFREALADAEKAISLNPKVHGWYNARGIAYGSLGMYGEALRDINTAIAYAPEVAASYYNRALTYAALKEYDKALSDYDLVLSREPDCREAYNNRGLIYVIKNDPGRAAADLEKACALGFDDGCRNLVKLKQWVRP